VSDCITLNDLRVLTVSGPERTAFLQGQLTQDVSLARADSTLLSGWADARGRLLFAGHLFTLGTGADAPLALLVPESLAESLLKRLRMYVLRAKVEITLSGLTVYGLYGKGEHIQPGAGQQLGYLHEDTRHLFLGPGGAALALDDSQQAKNSWLLADIRAGIPDIGTATSGEFVPQMINLDLLDAISFSKGCYTGQEIIARTKYLGRVKRRMLRFSADSAPPPPGTPIHAARGTVGQVVSAAATAAGSELLAVITIDDLPGPFFLDSDESRPLQRMDLPYEVPV
jgi:folate-binding protein YgfZ